MSPTCNGSTVLHRFKHGNAIKIRNGIMFDFYLGRHIYGLRKLKKAAKCLGTVTLPLGFCERKEQRERAWYTLFARTASSHGNLQSTSLLSSLRSIFVYLWDTFEVRNSIALIVKVLHSFVWGDHWITKGDCVTCLQHLARTNLCRDNFYKWRAERLCHSLVIVHTHTAWSMAGFFYTGEDGMNHEG